MPAAAARRDARTGRRVTFSPKVFVPLTMLCRDRCGYCTFAKPPARLDVAVPHRRRGARDRVAAAPSSAASRRCSRWARRPRTATRRRPSGSRPTATRDRRLPRRGGEARARRDRPAPPRERRRALRGASSTRLRAVSPSQGMMIETLAARLGEPGGPHYGAPDKTPARRLATLDAAGPRARAVHHRHPRRHRRDPRRAHRRAGRDRATRTAEHGHVQEVIVQNFLPKPGTSMHRAEPCPTDELLWSIAAARLILPGRRAPPGAAEPERRPRAVARGRHRRLGRRVAGDRRPREPRAAVARARPPARRDRGGGLRARAAPHDLPRVRARPDDVARPRRCAPGARRLRSRRPRARRRLVAGPRRSRSAAARCPRAGARAPAAPVGEVLAGVLAGRRGRRRRDRHAARRRAAPRSCASPRSPTSCAARSSATRSRSSATATSTTRTSARSSAGSARSRRARSRSTSAASRISLEMEEMQRRVVEAVECGATEVCLQGGIHPDFDGDYYVDVARAVKAVAPPDPRARLHRARGHRRRAPARHAARRLPAAG